MFQNKGISESFFALRELKGKAPLMKGNCDVVLAKLELLDWFLC